MLAAVSRCVCTIIVTIYYINSCTLVSEKTLRTASELLRSVKGLLHKDHSDYWDSLEVQSKRGNSQEDGLVAHGTHVIKSQCNQF